MTDNEIIKALERCKNKRCVNCPYDDVADRFAECSAILVNDAHDLINRQKAEIERKNIQIGELVSFQKFCEAKAIKEFAERLKNNIDLYQCIEEYYENAEICYEVRQDWFDEIIDNLAEEMTEGKKDG